MTYILKKSLGQHFLINENICQDIVNVVMHDNPIQLLEVGPGGGAITKYFLQQQNLNFKAVELDAEKVKYLEQNFPNIQNKIIHKSILEIDIPFEGKFSVVGNFPYNISTEILFKMLDWREQLNSVVGMFQKEVALRIAAKSGSRTYGVTSVLLQSFFSIEFLFDVAAINFDPPPNVESGVIKLKPLTTLPNFKTYAKLSLLVKTAFNQRRKTLRNAVKGLFEPEILIDPIFSKRAEQLSVEDFAKLTYIMR